MSDVKPEESTRTAYAASILLAFESAKKIRPNVALKDMLLAARRTATKRTLIYTGAALVSGYLAYYSTQAEPPKYKTATAFALLAAGTAYAAKRNARCLLTANHYIKMDDAQGAYRTHENMRAFAAPSLEIYNAMKND